MSKRRRIKRVRASFRQMERMAQSQSQVVDLQGKIRPAASSPALTHICGSRSSLDPRNPDGLTRLQREAIRAAATVQHCQAQGEVMASHMTIQTHFGWMVRACHPQDEQPVTIHDGRIAKLDEQVTTRNHVRSMVLTREEERNAQAAQRARLRSLAERREDVARADYNY